MVAVVLEVAAVLVSVSQCGSSSMVTAAVVVAYSSGSVVAAEVVAVW